MKIQSITHCHLFQCFIFIILYIFKRKEFFFFVFSLLCYIDPIYNREHALNSAITDIILNFFAEVSLLKGNSEILIHNTRTIRVSQHEHRSFSQKSCTELCFEASARLVLPCQAFSIFIFMFIREMNEFIRRFLL